MTPEEIKARLIKHAEWMVKSGQFGGTVEEYLKFIGYPVEFTPTETTAAEPKETSDAAE